MGIRPTKPHRTLRAAAGLTVLGVLFVISRYNYLLFHGLAELFAIAVAWSVFLLVWNTRRISSNDALLFVGIAYLFVGFIDLIHTLAYKGMGVFPDSAATNHATQLWIAARGIEAVALLLFPLLLGRRIRPWPVLLGCAGVTAFLLAAIFAWGIFPACYIEGAGLTGFKVGAEWVICAMLALAIALLFKRREFLDATVWPLLIAAMALSIAGELAFTLYTDVYGLWNVVGHLLKIVSLFMVYLALVHSTVVRPLATVFRGAEQERQMLAEEGRHLRLLHKTASLFRELETLDDTIGSLPDLIADHYGVPIVAIELYEADRQEMVFAGSVGIPKGEDGPLRVPVIQTISGTVATSGRAVIELNVSERADYRAEALRELGVVTFACVPLIGQEGVIGTLAVADREERPHIVGGADLLQALADSLTQEFERRRQNEQQRESEEKYRYLYETMTQGVVIQDAEGRIIEANRAAGHILGLTRDQLFGRTAYDPRWKLIREDGTPYDPSEMPSNIALRTGKTVEDVTCGLYVPEKDEYRWIIIGCSPQFRGSEPKPSLTMTVFTDITERHQAEDKRKNLVHDLGERIKELNCIYGLSDSIRRRDRLEDVFQDLADLIPSGWQYPEITRSKVRFGDREFVSEPFEETEWRQAADIIVDGRRCGSIEVFYTEERPDQNEGPFLAEERNLVERLAGDMALTLAKRRTDEALRESEARFHMALKNSPIIVFHQDSELRYTWIYNPHPEFDPQTILGKTDAELLPEDDAARLTGIKRRVLETGVSAREEVRTTIDGQAYFYDLTVEPLRNLSGATTGVTCVSVDITERKKAEEEHRTILSTAMDGFWITDTAGRFLEVNKSYCEMSGYAEHELLCMDISAVEDAKTAADTAAHMQRVIAEGQDRFESRHRRKDGSVFDVEVSVQYRPSDKPKCVVFIHDITERKRAEEALERRIIALTQPLDSQEGVSFEDLFNLEDIQRLQDQFASATGVASIITNTEGTPITRPSNFCRLCSDVIRKTDKGLTNCFKSDAALGKPNPDGPAIQPCLSGGLWDAGAGISVGGKHIANWLIGQVRDETQTDEKMRAYAREIGVDEAVVIEAFHEVPAMSREKFVEVAHALFTLANQLSDAAYRNVQQARFITERKQAEEALGESHEALSESQRFAKLGSWELDLNTQIIILSKEHQFMAGREAKETALPLAEYAADYIVEEDIAIIEDRLAFAVQNIENISYHDNFEYRLKTDDVGGYKNFAVQSRFKSKGIINGVTQDITDRKQAEVEKEKLESQLHQAQKMEAVGRLAGGVAHDFNNMLGVILGHADMLLEQIDTDQPFHTDLTEIRNAGMRSADLTRQLLAFARKQTVAPKVIDLNKTVTDMTRMLKRLIGEDIDLAWVPDDKLWPVKIDPGQIDQILANLCVNARDAIAGVGKVTIETHSASLDEAYCADHTGFVPGEYVMLAVSDNGCGMDAELLDNIFEPFFTTKEQDKGTGLGLATVYGAVKQNNGFINVYSKPGQGTTFKIYLPRHATKAVETEEREPQAAARGSEAILLVEDEPAILRMTTRMLEREGYTVVAAGTPGEAIERAHIHSGEIHLLMTDVVMPEMNGRDLARNILSHYPNLKCLFMSGYTANVIAHHGVLDEGVNFIQKPFSKGDLAAKVREALERE